jgi:hypothetical protein
VLAEIVCFDAAAEPLVSGLELSLRALEHIGFGEDFVYTVASLEGAIDHAVATLPSKGSRGSDGWEGEAVVVLDPPAVADRADRHVGSARSATPAIAARRPGPG